MEKIITVLQTVLPIFVVVFLGMLARKRQILSANDVQGLQNFVLKFALPCVVFNSCITAKIGVESLATMGLSILVTLCGALWAFRYGRKMFPYHNIPMFFCCHETGMLGIPLFIILFGADQAYRMGVLDVAQASVVFPVMAILTSDTGESPNPLEITKKVLASPLMIMAMIGLVLKFSGLADLLDSFGLLAVLTESASFLTQPISTLMIFSVGYNFSLEKKSRGPVFKVSAVRFVFSAVLGVAIQLVLCLIPNVDSLTRITMLMYSTLPISYVTPSLGRDQDDYTVASGVCSVLTAASLVIFCIIAAFVA